MKNLLLIVSLLGNSILLAQSSSFPTKEQAKNRLESIKGLKEEIGKLMGASYASLKVEHDGWAGYKGSGFSLTRTDCGKKMYKKGYPWPSDAAYTKYVISGKKNKEGVYKVMGVYIFYKKSEQNNGECLLTNTWKYWDYKVEKPIEYGYYEFKKEEANKLLMDYLKSGEATALNDFVEISKIDLEYFSQSSESAGSHFLSWFFKGKKAHYTLDGTSILGLEDYTGAKLKMKVEKVDGKWKVTNFGVYDQYSRPLESNYYAKDIEKNAPFYTNYEKGGWNAIYPKMTESEKESGDIENLEKRVGLLMNVLKEKGLDLTFEDIKPFVIEKDVAKFKVWYEENYVNADRRYVVKSYKLEKAYPVLFPSEEPLYVGFPELSVETNLMKKKNKRKWEKDMRCTGCSKYSTSSLNTTSHSMVWKWNNGEWYLNNPESIFLMSKEKWDYRR